MAEVDRYQIRYAKLMVAVMTFWNDMNNPAWVERLADGGPARSMIASSHAAYKFYNQVHEIYDGDPDVKIAGGIEKLMQIDLKDFQGFRVTRSNSHFGAARPRLNTDGASLMKPGDVSGGKPELPKVG